MFDFEFELQDRIAKIQSINSEYDLENNARISFSGGKDSTILHYLIDIALPNNKIPRVFINTGIEYKMIVDFVKGLAINDNRFVILNAGKNIKKTLDEVGYPFKSKIHSSKVGQYQLGSRAKSVLDYKNRQGKFRCPKKLLYQYDEDFSIKLSDKCCYEFKVKPFAQYQSETGRTIALTGMRKEEGGRRMNMSCIVTDKAGNIKKFHPLAVISEQWEEWFIEKFNIKLCKLYYPPFNFKRTGCKGCPFALDLDKQLDIMEKYLPAERKQCEFIWKPVYDEYRRINYRLKKHKQLKMF